MPSRVQYAPAVLHEKTGFNPPPPPLFLYPRKVRILKHEKKLLSCV